MTGRLIFSVHGGPSKAVYVYPSEHYDYWKQELPEMKLPWGMFGENFTTTGPFESELNIGDEFRVGSAVVMVTEPRMPCYTARHQVQLVRHDQEVPGERAYGLLFCRAARGRSH